MSYSAGTVVFTGRFVLVSIQVSCDTQLKDIVMLVVMGVDYPVI